MDKTAEHPVRIMDLILDPLCRFFGEDGIYDHFRLRAEFFPAVHQINCHDHSQAEILQYIEKNTETVRHPCDIGSQIGQDVSLQP